MHEETTNDNQIADADLILRTRSGDTAAFGELWRRHHRSGLSVARSITSSIDPDDLVQESYTRIYQAIVKGGGPNGSFRAYLFTSIRNTAAGWGRSRRETAIDELDTVADPSSTEQATNEALDRSLTAKAFRSMPTRWQEVLWYTEIEQMKPQEVAPLLGMSAGAVSQLAFRAREGLREAWIQAHLSSAAPGSDCQWAIEHLGAYSRGNLSARDHKRLEAHLDDCARCMIVAAEAKDVSRRLALVLLPLVLGIAGSAGYLATLQGGGAPIAALAGGASGIPNGVVADPASSAAAGAASGAASASASASTGAGFSLLSGIGALVGAGSVALIVAGVVAAATIIPGLTRSDAKTSQPSAADPGASSINTNIAPDDSLKLNQPVVVPTPAPTPTPEPIKDTLPLLPIPPLTDKTGVVLTPPITTPVTPPAVPTDLPVVPTDPPVVPTDTPVVPTDPPVVPTDPPALPEGAPAIVSMCTTGGELGVSAYRLQIHGSPGATVQATVTGISSVVSPVTLDANGDGSVDIVSSLDQDIDPEFALHYVNGALSGPLSPPIPQSGLTATGGCVVEDLPVEQAAPPADVPAPANPPVIDPAVIPPATTDPTPTDPGTVNTLVL